MKPLSIRNISLLSQALIFLGLFIVQTLPIYWNISFPTEFWIKQSLMYALWLVIFFINYRILLPHLLFKGRNGYLFIVVIALLVSVIYISNGFDAILDLENILDRHFHHTKKNNHEGNVIANFSEIIITLLMLGASTVISVAKKLQMENQARQSLEQEKTASELSFLKSQINPHFFFNILNSIYSLTDASNTPARDAVYTLSHLMRYVLYDTKNNLTTLSREIAFVDDYLQLMRLRISDNVQVIFEKPAVIKDIEVAPMSFLPFIENAFKHGISGIHPSYVFIGIEQSDGGLQIEVRNSLFQAQPEITEESNGIGLANTRRRLDLIYPGKYMLSTVANVSEKEYKVVLKLSL